MLNSDDLIAEVAKLREALEKANEATNSTALRSP
jgi:hypothetical protein